MIGDLNDDNAQSYVQAMGDVSENIAEPVQFVGLKSFFETNLQQKRAENDRQRLRNKELTNEYHKLGEEKWLMLCHMCLPKEAAKIDVSFNQLVHKNHEVLQQMQKIFNSEDEVSAAYSAHCDQVLADIKASQASLIKHDNYTMMSTLELAEMHQNLQVEIEKVRDNLVDAIAALREKEKQYEVQHQMLLDETLQLKQYETESTQAVEQLQLEKLTNMFINK